MPRPCHQLGRLCVTVAVSLMLAACASTGGGRVNGAIVPFTTDGCSFFPDRSCKANWCSCCLVHDLAYWRGGTADERIAADQALRQCVRRASGNVLATVMYAGTRLGGSSVFPTTFRWGYGWPVGRPYGALTADEDFAASALQREYIATNPALSCPGHASPAVAPDDGLHSPGR